MKEFFRAFLGSCLGVLISFLLLILLGFSLIGIIASSSEEKVEIAPKTILKIELDQPIFERTPTNPFDNFDFGSMKSNKPLGLNSIVSNLKKAKTDPNIAGVYMDLTTVNAPGFATVQEIRNAIVDFKKSGKFVVAFSDTYTQIAYYLASAADKIYMNPEGNLELLGLKAQVMFYKGTLDKLGVQAQIIRHGKFKSAVEPFMLDKMSPANREQMDALLGSIWNEMTAEISKSRNVSAEELNNIANNLSAPDGKSAVNAKLVDELLYKDQVIAKLASFAKVEKDKDPEAISLAKYDQVIPEDQKYSKEKIAVIYANGEVVMGSDSKNLSEKEISATIREARKDENIKAIVLRVNSPGGSALASEIIWREMELARKAKPVVVSMGDLAASGGYYITAPANVIYAQPTTLTGSIGVFGVLFNAEKGLKDKLGITVDVAKTNSHADMGQPFRMLNNDETAAIQKEIERIYGTFTGHVSAGRRLPVSYIDSIGQGRVWSGVMAQKLKLVDKLGGLTDAIAEAAKLAKLKEYKTVDLPEQKSTFSQIMAEFTGESISTMFARGQFEESIKSYNEIRSFIKNQGVQARLPFWLEIR
ncbi:signal peptide peptidase SppA [Alistipes sp. ZOR0009]|uniref:signal peptide peptidase SppA n=1 Tax=Alistipes sp. ZOR0009 TaxID=1339253 RepID=UPI0006468C09|nr:signal peptide peptidase SppA [Alistipes sp. ZOR0009]